jgi:hypothetical protein
MFHLIADLFAWHRFRRETKRYQQFNEWYEVHQAAQNWTAMQCPVCHQPAATPDARFCVQCGHELHSSFATEPVAIPSVAVQIDEIGLQETVRRLVSQSLYPDPGERHTDRIPASIYLENKHHHPEWGAYTQATRAIRKQGDTK